MMRNWLPQEACSTKGLGDYSNEIARVTKFSCKETWINPKLHEFDCCLTMKPKHLGLEKKMERGVTESSALLSFLICTRWTFRCFEREPATITSRIKGLDVFPF